ncbi:MAG TPA: hypothetical protein VJ904_09360 [Tichowtungia sp.]|nr:hypothetical protein [Tichowtungia sp.]HKL26552.1 hypothetical protein [Desulfuromonadales bacterium]
MAAKGWYGWVMAAVALTAFVIGGIGVMAGLIMVGFLGARDIWGWGEARSVGYLFFLVGVCLSVFGVLVMRIMRNRF